MLGSRRERQDPSLLGKLLISLLPGHPPPCDLCIGALRRRAARASSLQFVGAIGELLCIGQAPLTNGNHRNETKALHFRYDWIRLVGRRVGERNGMGGGVGIPPHPDQRLGHGRPERCMCTWIGLVDGKHSVGITKPPGRHAGNHCDEILLAPEGEGEACPLPIRLGITGFRCCPRCAGRSGRLPSASTAFSTYPAYARVPMRCNGDSPITAPISLGERGQCSALTGTNKAVARFDEPIGGEFCFTAGKRVVHRGHGIAEGVKPACRRAMEPRNAGGISSPQLDRKGFAEQVVVSVLAAGRDHPGS